MVTDHIMCIGGLTWKVVTFLPTATITPPISCPICEWYMPCHYDVIIIHWCERSKPLWWRFYTWYHREGSRAPLLSGLMYVRMTDARELDVDDHVIITTRSSSKREGRELAACLMRSVSHTLSWFIVSCTHDVLLDVRSMTEICTFKSFALNFCSRNAVNL